MHFTLMILWRGIDIIFVRFFSQTFSCNWHIKWCCNINVEYAMKFLLRIIYIFCVFHYNNQLSKLTSTFLNCLVIVYVCVCVWVISRRCCNFHYAFTRNVFICYVSVNINYKFGTLAIFTLIQFAIAAAITARKTFNIYHKIVASVHFAVCCSKIKCSWKNDTNEDGIWLQLLRGMVACHVQSSSGNQFPVKDLTIIAYPRSWPTR